MSIPTQRAPFVTSYFQGSKTLAFSLLFLAGVISWWWPCLPVVLPCGAPAAVVDHHTTGSQMSPFTDYRSELDPPYLQCCLDFFFILRYKRYMYIISDIITTRHFHHRKLQSVMIILYLLRSLSVNTTTSLNVQKGKK